MSVLLSHPTGNQNARHAAQALAEIGLLACFVTALHVPVHNLPWRALPAGLLRQLARRDFSGVGGTVRSVAPLREWVRMLAGRAGLRGITAHEQGWASVDRLYAAVDRATAATLCREDAIRAVYAYEDGAIHCFEAARSRGLPRIYELPIGYWRAHRTLCAEEAARMAAWAHTWNPGQDSAEKRERKDAELSLATRVIVPSDFVAQTLEHYPGKLPPITVLPYGCPPPISAAHRTRYNGGTLRVLFVGGLSQRKGLAYLLRAAEAMGSAIELTVIGTGPGAAFAGLHARLLGSIPHGEVLEHMRTHHVLVFPTLFEGQALVIGEALSQGLPVVTTVNSGATRLVKHGVNGWMVPVCDAEAIESLLADMIRHPSLLDAAGEAALQAAGSWQWQDYRQALSDVVKKDLS